jgi:hypothetical protein
VNDKISFFFMLNNFPLYICTSIHLREEVGAGGRNDPSLVYTCELKKKSIHQLKGFRAFP